MHNQQLLRTKQQWAARVFFKADDGRCFFWHFHHLMMTFPIHPFMSFHKVSESLSHRYDKIHFFLPVVDFLQFDIFDKLHCIEKSSALYKLSSSPLFQCLSQVLNFCLNYDLLESFIRFHFLSSSLLSRSHSRLCAAFNIKWLQEGSRTFSISNLILFLKKEKRKRHFYYLASAL